MFATRWPTPSATLRQKRSGCRLPRFEIAEGWVMYQAPPAGAFRRRVDGLLADARGAVVAAVRRRRRREEGCPPSTHGHPVGLALQPKVRVSLRRIPSRLLRTGSAGAGPGPGRSHLPSDLRPREAHGHGGFLYSGDEPERIPGHQLDYGLAWTFHWVMRPPSWPSWPEPLRRCPIRGALELHLECGSSPGAGSNSRPVQSEPQRRGPGPARCGGRRKTWLDGPNWSSRERSPSSRDPLPSRAARRQVRGVGQNTGPRRGPGRRRPEYCLDCQRGRRIAAGGFGPVRLHGTG